MAQGRGNATTLAATFGLAFLCLLLNTKIVESTVYNVGDNGWTFSISGWPAGKNFKAGDVLVFKYDTSVHNVVQVNAGGYRSCSVPGGSRVFKSGSDRVTLARGTNYFICSFASHCQAGGMKIAVTAA